ncbi:hypothetical protein MTo_02187 [Microcystis aeruginosa NIES-1211]|nr:hypothetical protein MTo_02187 [Microcystis aeruginosa NIES-1211]
MWLIDHQMNVKVSNTFGQYFVRLPLKKAAKIVHGNALRIDWEELISKEKLNFILGNPPFVGKQLQNADQKADMNHVLGDIKGAGVLDYVTAWYIKASEFIQNSLIRCALVSTNSISQGEQVGVLWQELYQKYKIKIHFAHRTFSWSNEAKGNAAVHCVIIGFGLEDIDNKRIFDYADIKGEPTERRVKNINPYLTEGNDLIILKKIKPICNVPEMIKGSQPTDGGNLLMNDEEKEQYIRQEPAGEKFIKPFISADEFLNNKRRWCFWLTEIQPKELKQLPLLLKRVEAVKEMRLASSKVATIKWAQFPTLFTENRQPETDYVLVPRVSSENRKYIPLGFFNKNIIVSDTCIAIPRGSIYHFGILTSEMHMAWVKYVCGRLESRFRYSNTIVYNNYPFPENITDKQKQTVETCAQTVLDTRVKYPDSSLADLYDPLTMPPDLLKAHQKLDKAVDLCYRPQPFTSELNRIEYLFELYEKLTAPLLPTSKQKPAKRKNPQ